MKSYKITVAYDGTHYHGWQSQKDTLTIVGVLQARFKSVFNKDISLFGASRTDAGVHALGQVALLQTDLDGEIKNLQNAWNAKLPKDILIRSLFEANSLFHPQRNVISKTYWYHFFIKRPLPFCAPYGWYIYKELNLSKLQDCLNLFVGTHDFRSFCTGYERENTTRTIDSLRLSFIPHYRSFRIEVKGPGFLRYMLRRIIGASILIASTQRSPQEILHALEQKNPEQHFLTAPAHGLLLRKILYGEN